MTRPYNRRSDAQILAACRVLEDEGKPVTAAIVGRRLAISGTQTRARLRRLVDCGSLVRHAAHPYDPKTHYETARGALAPGVPDPAIYAGARYTDATVRDVALKTAFDLQHARRGRREQAR